jgi:hypothetical protein
MRIVALVATLVLVSESLSGDVLAQALAATFRGDAFHDTSPPLRDLVGSATDPRVLPLPELDLTALSGTAPMMPLGPLRLSLVENFPGIATPPGFMGTPWATDASGAIGPDHFMQSVNFSAAICDKSGTLLLGPFATSTFWNGFAARAVAGGRTSLSSMTAMLGGGS